MLGKMCIKTNQMQLKSITSTFVFILLALSGCYKCEQQELASLHFTQEELRIIPYTSQQDLIFVSQSGDSVAFISTIRMNQYLKFYKYKNDTILGDKHGCLGDYYCADVNGFYSSEVDHLQIQLSFLYRIDDPNSEKGINILIGFDIGKYPPIPLIFYGSYKFEVDTLLNDPTSPDSIASYYQNLSIGGVNYHGVYELYCEIRDPRYPEWISTAYYSITDGLLGFRTNYNKSWELVKQTI